MADFFNLEVIDEGVNAQLALIKQQYGAAAQRIVVATGYETMAAEVELEPVDYGNMRGSTQLVQESRTVTTQIQRPAGAKGRAGKAAGAGESYEVSGPVEVGTTEVAIVVGADYAAAVNCDEDAQHEVGQAHFAETALQQVAQRKLPERLAAGLLPGMGINPL
jgi:hypothetical protein